MCSWMEGTFHNQPRVSDSVRLLPDFSVASRGAEQVSHFQRAAFHRRSEGRVDGDIADLPTRGVQAGQFAHVHPLEWQFRRQHAPPNLGALSQVRKGEHDGEP